MAGQRAGGPERDSVVVEPSRSLGGVHDEDVQRDTVSDLQARLLDQPFVLSESNGVAIHVDGELRIMKEPAGQELADPTHRREVPDRSGYEACAVAVLLEGFLIDQNERVIAARSGNAEAVA